MKNGDMCKNYASANSIHCHLHNPETQEEAKASRSAGSKIAKLKKYTEEGFIKAREPIEIGKINTLYDVEQALKATTQALLNADIDHNTANAANQLLKSLYKSIFDKLEARELSDDMTDDKLVTECMIAFNEMGLIPLVVKELEKYVPTKDSPSN